MSTQAKPKRQPVAPRKNAKKDNVAAPAPAVPVVEVVPAPAPAPVAQAPAAETTPAPVSETPTGKTRVQTNKLLGVGISPARVRRHLDKLTLNAKLDGMIAELKAQLAPWKLATAQLESGKKSVVVEKEVDGKKVLSNEQQDLTEADRAAAQKTVADLAPRVPELKSRIAALSKERTRFSQEASIALSVVCDELIQELVFHTMDNALKAKKKIIQVVHLHEAGVEKLTLYPLVKSLGSFASMHTKLTDAARVEEAAKALAVAVAAARKEIKREYGAAKKKKVTDGVPPAVIEAPAPAPVPVAEDNDEEDAHDQKTSFKFYVKQVCDAAVATDPKYSAIKISTEIKEYLSDLLIEFIQRLGSLVSLTTASMKNKTVNETAIMRTVESILVDGHSAHETIEFKEAQVHDPERVKAETKKREEEKKAGREYKIDLAAIPLVRGFIATRTVVYPTSGFPALKQKVGDKLTAYEALCKKEAEPAVATA